MSEFKNLPSGWKVVRLGDVFEKITIKNRPDEPILTIKQGIGTILRENSDRQILFDKKRISTYKFVKNNDFIIHLRSFEGGFEMSNHQGIVSPAYIILRNKILISHLYFKFFFRSHLFIHKILAICVEGIRDGKQLNFDTVKNLKIPFPPLDEQEKIAEILSTWDEAINLTINLIENKKQFKKALMQNLLTAKVRFPEFQDEWREVKLGNIGVFKTSSVDKIIQKGECIVNLVNYMDVYRNTHINSSLKLSQTSASNREIENLSLAKGDVLFTPSSETPDDIGHSAVILSDMPNTLFSYHLVRFRLDIKNDIVFLGYIFNQDKILKQFARLSQGATRYTLSIRDFQNIFINLPNLKEQQKIAEVLTAFDDEINLLNLKLENLKKQKQGLMQKLLKGEMRTCYVKKAM